MGVCVRLCVPGKGHRAWCETFPDLVEVKVTLADVPVLGGRY